MRIKVFMSSQNSKTESQRIKKKLKWIKIAIKKTRYKSEINVTSVFENEPSDPSSNPGHKMNQHKPWID